MKRPGGFDSEAERAAERAAEPAESSQLPARESAARRFLADRAERREAERVAREERASAQRVAAELSGAERAAAEPVTAEPVTADLGADDQAQPDEAVTQDLSAHVNGVRPDAGPDASAAEPPEKPTRDLQRRRENDPVRAAEKQVRAAEKQNRRRTRSETRRFTAALRRTRRRTFVVVGTMLLLVAFVLLCAFSPLMAVREIQVEGAQEVDATAVTQALAEFEGRPLALVEENDVLRALRDFPRIQRFAVERKPPHTLVVRIEERAPVIALAEGESFKLYDAAGVLVGESGERPAGVPVAGDGLGATSSKAFGAAAKVIRDLPEELRAQIDSVNAQTGQDVTFTLANGIEVFWGNDSQTRRKALVLQTLMRSLADREVSYIDVSSSDAPIFK